MVMMDYQSSCNMTYDTWRANQQTQYDNRVWAYTMAFQDTYPGFEPDALTDTAISVGHGIEILIEEIWHILNQRPDGWQELISDLCHSFGKSQSLSALKHVYHYNDFGTRVPLYDYV